MWPKLKLTTVFLAGTMLGGCGDDPAEVGQHEATLNAAAANARLRVAGEFVLARDLPGCDAVPSIRALAREARLLRHPADDGLVVVVTGSAGRPVCIDTLASAIGQLGVTGQPRVLVAPKAGARLDPEGFVGIGEERFLRPDDPGDEPVPPIQGDRADDPVPPIHGHGGGESGDDVKPGAGGQPEDGAVAVSVRSLAL